MFSLTYSTGCGVVPWLLAPELLPLKALAAGSALGNAGNWLMNFLSESRQIKTCISLFVADQHLL